MTASGQLETTPTKTLYTRVVNIMSHGNYSLYEPIEMVEENKALFKTILDDFRKNFPFNPDARSKTRPRKRNHA